MLDNVSLCVCKVTQSCLTLYHPMDYSPPDSSAYGILQAKILDCLVIPYSRGSSQAKGQGFNPPFFCLLYWQWGSVPLALSGKPMYPYS